MGFFDSVTKNASILKLNGDISLLDRQMIQRKSQFGIDLYDLITNLQQSKTLPGGLIKMPSLFNHNENIIKEPYEAYHIEIIDIIKEIEYKNLEIHHLSSARERAKPAITTGESMKKAGSRISDAAQETKLQFDITMLERKIKSRKEQFGLDVYDLVVSTIASTPSATSGGGTAMMDAATERSTSGSNNSVKNLFGGASKTISKNLSKLNSSESDIKNCVLLAKRDVEFIQKQKDFKQKEINTLKASSS